jgi:ABC-type polysaccharide transport system permease subunit
MAVGSNKAARRKGASVKTMKRSFRLHWELYLLLLVPIVITFIFQYIPMAGIQIAFREFRPTRGIWNSEWVGLKYFQQMIDQPSFMRVVTNTLVISVSNMLWTFPFPIILAVMLNGARNKAVKRTVQMVTYAPYFISTIIMVGITLQLLDMRTGLFNYIITSLGFPAINFLARPETFLPTYIITSIWHSTGYGSVIYLAALSAISPELHEAAIADGASRVRRLWHIDLPGIVPTMTIIFIMNFGSIISVGFEKAFALQNSVNMNVSEVISTYVYKNGIQRTNYSFTTAIGFANSVINLVLIFTVNAIAKRVGETSLW